MTETTDIAPIPQEALEKYSGNPVPDIVRLEQLVGNANRAEIKGPADMESGADLDRMLAAGIKKLDDNRKLFVGPLNEVVKRINDNYKVPLYALKVARKTIQDKMTQWREAQRRRALEEEAAARAVAEEQALQEAEKLEAAGENEKAEAVLEDAVELPVSSNPVEAGPVRGDYGGTSSFVKYWEVEVNFPDKVPREFCSPDMKKIKAGVDEIAKRMARSGQALNEIQIEGCIITEKERVITR